MEEKYILVFDELFEGGKITIESIDDVMKEYLEQRKGLEKK